MKILFVASEMTPLASTGGLADVIGSLPRELKMLGHDVRVIMPCYRTLNRLELPIRKARKSIEVLSGSSSYKGFLRQTTIDDITVYLLESRDFFDRDHLYGPPGGDYPDNHRRFAFFCRGVLDMLKRMDFRPDILHCHDWQTALLPIILRYEHHNDPFFAGMATLFTIHNLAFQGVFPRSALEEMGLDKTCYRIERLEFYGQVNLMKGALLTANLLNTVSPTYRNEILTPELGCGLDGVLRSRRDDLVGVLNGIDTVRWDPATDRALAKNYTASSLASRQLNKQRLQKQLGLAVDPNIPLVGIVSRLAEQKGFDLIVETLPRIAAENIQLAILGEGDDRYVREFASLAQSEGKKISLSLGYNPALAAGIFAGSDIFLMPSRFEPCGLAQMVALRYGAVPVVHKVGGLADTISDERCGAKEPNGFTFDDYTATALWEALQRAVATFGDKSCWRRMVRNGMRHNFSWASSSRQYDDLYRRCLVKKRGY